MRKRPQLQLKKAAEAAAAQPRPCPSPVANHGLQGGRLSQPVVRDLAHYTLRVATRLTTSQSPQPHFMKMSSFSSNLKRPPRPQQLHHQRKFKLISGLNKVTTKARLPLHPPSFQPRQPQPHGCMQTVTVYVNLGSHQAAVIITKCIIDAKLNTLSTGLGTTHNLRFLREEPVMPQTNPFPVEVTEANRLRLTFNAVKNSLKILVLALIMLKHQSKCPQ